MSPSTDHIAQQAHVFRPDELPEKSRGGGARTIPLVTAARGATTYLNGITTFEPGAAIAHHTHNVAESVMVIKGAAIVDIDGARTPLRTFDTTFVPANIPHHFENASEQEEMKIFWTYGSIDATRTIVDSKEHGRVDDETPAAERASLRMVREIATIQARPGHQAEFEAAVARAALLFQASAGARTLTLDRSEEEPTRYTLTIGWESIEDHTHGFRNSSAFAEWRALIADHVIGTPQVHHVRNVLTAF